MTIVFAIGTLLVAATALMKFRQHIQPPEVVGTFLTDAGLTAIQRQMGNAGWNSDEAL